MTSDWPEEELGQHVLVRHGYAFKGEFISNEPSPEANVLLTPGNFEIGGGFRRGSFKYYVGPVSPEFVLSEGDLLVTMTDLSKQSDTLGYPAVIPRQEGTRVFLHNQRLGKVIPRSSGTLDIRFLQYLLRTSRYRHEILASATGTTVKHTSPARILRFRFARPPLDTQRAIAHILGTLDDKIELNRRMNETLEAMARALFQSWFVDFDPVRAKAEGRDPGLSKPIADLIPSRLVDSPLGGIPEGWATAPLPDLIEVNPTSALRKGAPAPYLDMANTPTIGHVAEVAVVRPFGSGAKFRNGDTLVARITPCLENGKTCFVDFLAQDEVGWGSTEFIVLRSRPPLPPEFAYCLARSPRFREFSIQGMTGTSGRQRVPPDSLNHFGLAEPPDPLAFAFGEFVGPLFASIRARANESRTLAALRDTLLPKLISGELRVGDADRLVADTL